MKPDCVVDLKKPRLFDSLLVQGKHRPLESKDLEAPWGGGVVG